MKKIIYMMVACLALIMLFPTGSYASGEAVTIASATATNSTAKVNGETDALAVMVQVRDSDNNIVSVMTLPVDEEGKFSGTLSGFSLPTGEEAKIYIADFEGGSWAISDVVVQANPQSPSPDSDDDNDDEEEVKLEEKADALTADNQITVKPITKGTPNITPVEPTKTLTEELSVPVENIEAELPEGISEEAKEVLVEQVAETVSDLVDAILEGDDTIENAISEETLENIKTALDAGKTIIAVVKAEVVDESSIPSEEKASIDDIIAKEKDSNIEIACYLNISVIIKTSDGEILGTYNELTSAVTFTIEAPKDMPCPEGKEYVVIRIHNGESSILPVTVNADGTLSFETNEFSTYALALRDKEEVVEASVEKEEVQATGKALETTPATPEEPVKEKSKVWIWVIVALMVVVGGFAAFFAFKKKDE